MDQQTSSLQSPLGGRDHFSETMSGATALHERAVAMNEALVLGSIHQHELTEAAENLNLRLLAEINERKLVEEALRASDQRLSLAHAELADHAAKLESLVAERTAALSATNRKLETSIASIEKGKEEFRSLLVESEAMQEKLRNLTRHFLTTQEDERREISRELHDQIAQMLVGIYVELAALGNTGIGGTVQMKARIAAVQRLVEESIAGIHRFARDLRPAVLDDLGLNPALHSYLKDFIERTGIRVDFSTYEKVETMKMSVRTVFFRIAQESLANVARHAGVSRAALDIREIDGNVRMEIKDQGVGFDVNGLGSNRLGLLGMKERIEMMGGTFRVESRPGGPTTVRVEIKQARSRGNRKSAEPKS